MPGRWRGQPSQRQQGSTTLASYAYTLDAVGNRTKVTEADGTTVSWSYDDGYRLTGETQADSAGTVVAQASYTYDGVGNRLSMASGGVTTTYSYNALDQLTSATTSSQSTAYSYDGRGNLTSATTSGSGASTTTSYRWNAANNLVGVTPPDGTTASYSYDADGRRVSQTTAGGTTNFLWDIQSPHGDIVAETDGSSGAVQASYALGDGALLAETRSGTTSYTLPDGQGSVRALSDSTGALTDTYRYDAFGNVQSSQGTTTNPYGYDGQRYDTQTGLYQLRARSHNPGTGRFLSRDPAAATTGDPTQLDRYVYARANPIAYSDPAGLESMPEVAEIEANTTFSVARVGGALWEMAKDTGVALAVAVLAPLVEMCVELQIAAPLTDYSCLKFLGDLYSAGQEVVQAFEILYQMVASLGPAPTAGAGGSGGSGSGTGGGGSGGTTPNQRAAMRVQLQEQVGPGKTIHHDSIQLFDTGGGVTTTQVVDALTKLRSSPAIPKKEQKGATSAYAAAVRWTQARPPAGVIGQFSKSFYFNPQSPSYSWRFDIEGIYGRNLTS